MYQINTCMIKAATLQARKYRIGTKNRRKL